MNIILAIETLLVVVVAGTMFPQPAHAYIDLGVGSFMLQVLFGMVLAIWVSLKGLCLRIPFFARCRKPSSATNER